MLIHHVVMLLISSELKMFLEFLSYLGLTQQSLNSMLRCHGMGAVEFIEDSMILFIEVDTNVLLAGLKCFNHEW